MWYRYASEFGYNPLEEKAIEYYGITGDHRKAGFILKDGTLIDFSEGYHERALDHRDVRNIMPENEIHDNDYDNYVEPFIKDTGALRISNYGYWNIDINTRPTNAQISYIASKHIKGESFCFDYMGNRDCIDNATKDKVFNFLKQIQEDWDKNHVV
jgi:hypothetical protein